MDFILIDIREDLVALQLKDLALDVDEVRLLIFTFLFRLFGAKDVAVSILSLDRLPWEHLVDRGEYLL